MQFFGQAIIGHEEVKLQCFSTQKKLQIFTSRIDKIVTDWLKAKGCRDITELGQYKFIKESLKVWVAIFTLTKK